MMPKDIPKIDAQTINAPYIRQVNGFVERKISVINGYLFYRSSGSASKFSGTWFPFLGLSVNHEFYGKGWYIKPDHNQALKDYIEQIIELNLKTYELPARFGSIVSMLISSVIGGGFWKTEDGQAVEKQLRKDYPNFYDSIRIKLIGHKSKTALERQNTLKFEGNDKVDEINSWAKAEIVKFNIKDFKIAARLSDIIKFEDVIANKKPKLTKQKNKVIQSSKYSNYALWLIGGLAFALISSMSIPLVLLGSLALGKIISSTNHEESKVQKLMNDKVSEPNHQSEVNKQDHRNNLKRSKTLILSDLSLEKKDRTKTTREEIEQDKRTAKHKRLAD